MWPPNFNPCWPRERMFPVSAVIVALFNFFSFVLGSKTTNSPNVTINIRKGTHERQLQVACQNEQSHDERVTVAVRNNYPDWINIVGSADAFKISSKLDDLVPSKSADFSAKTALLILSSLEGQIDSSMLQLRQTITKLERRQYYEMDITAYVYMTLMYAHKILQEARVLVTRLPVDTDLTTDPTVMAELLGHLLRAMIAILQISHMENGNMKHPLIADHISIIEGILPIMLQVRLYMPEESYAFFKLDLAAIATKLIQKHDNIYSQSALWYANFCIERISSVLLKLFLELIHLNPFVTFEIWEEMLEKYYPSNALKGTLAIPIREITSCLSITKPYIFRTERLFVSVMRDTFDNIYASIFRNEQLPNSLVSKVILLVHKYIQLHKKEEFEGTLIGKEIQKIADLEEKKKILLTVTHRSKKFKTRFPSPILKKPKGEKKTKKKSNVGGKKGKKVQKNNIKDVASQLANLHIDEAKKTNEISVSTNKPAEEPEIPKEMLTISSGSSIKEENVDVDIQKPSKEEPSKPIKNVIVDPQETHLVFWSAAPNTIRQHSELKSEEPIDPFKSLNKVLPHVMLIGEYCRHEVLGRYVEAMNMTQFTWEDVRASLNTAPSLKALERLDIYSPNVVANCIDLLVYRHAIAHPVVDLKDVIRIHEAIYTAVAYDMIGMAAAKALYDVINRVQKDTHRTLLPDINWTAKFKRDSHLSAEERVRALLLLGEIANSLVLCPFKDYMKHVLGQTVLDDNGSNKSDMAIYEIKLIKMEAYAKDIKYAKLLVDLRTYSSAEFSSLASIVRLRNEIAHPKYWIGGSLKRSIEEINLASPHAVSSLRNYIEEFTSRF